MVFWTFLAAHLVTTSALPSAVFNNNANNEQGAAVASNTAANSFVPGTGGGPQLGNRGNSPVFAQPPFNPNCNDTEPDNYEECVYLDLVCGVVKNAKTGDGLADVTVTYAGGAYGGPIVTNENGTYWFQCAPKGGTLIIEKAGYYTETLEITESTTDLSESERRLQGCPQNPSKNANMVPTISDGYVIVFKWGSFPKDLDSYLAFGAACSEDDDEVSWRQRLVVMDYPSGQTIATLDVDKRGGFGPETITINGTANLAEEMFYYALDDAGKGPFDSDAEARLYGPTGLLDYRKSACDSNYVWYIWRFNVDGTFTVMDTHPSTHPAGCGPC